jgi:cyclophilin family peptidyl-prolyl cis-trans isomerase
MRKILFWPVLAFLVLFPAACDKKNKQLTASSPAPTGEALTTYMQWDEPPDMTIDTGKIYLATITVPQGEIKIELFADKSPVSVNNFIFLINQGFYNKTTFHIVDKKNFAQGGKPPVENLTGPGYKIQKEIHPDLRFDDKGILGMAQSRYIGSQFFITYTAMPWMDGDLPIIGKVVEGLDVLDALTPKKGWTNPDYAGDPIEEMTVTEIPGSLIPEPTPTPEPRAPELTGGRPLAEIPFEQRKYLYNTPPEMVIDVNKSYTAVFKTTKGDISFELFPDLAPLHVNNFYVLVNLGYYDDFPITKVLRSRYVRTGAPDKDQRADVGYALPAEINMEQKKGALCAWLHMSRDAARSSSGSIIAMLMTNDPHGIIAHTRYGLTSEEGVNRLKTLTEEDMITNVEIIVK